MSAKANFYVTIIDAASGAVVQEMPAHSEHQANKIDAGVNINLHHERFYTMVYTADALQEYKDKLSSKSKTKVAP